MTNQENLDSTTTISDCIAEFFRMLHEPRDEEGKYKIEWEKLSIFPSMTEIEPARGLWNAFPHRLTKERAKMGE